MSESFQDLTVKKTLQCHGGSSFTHVVAHNIACHNSLTVDGLFQTNRTSCLQDVKVKTVDCSNSITNAGSFFNAGPFNQATDASFDSNVTVKGQIFAHNIVLSGDIIYKTAPPLQKCIKDMWSHFVAQNIQASIAICFIFDPHHPFLEKQIAGWHETICKNVGSSCSISTAAASWLICRFGTDIFSLDPHDLSSHKPLQSQLSRSLACTEQQSELLVRTIKPNIHALEGMLSIELDTPPSCKVGVATVKKWLCYASTPRT